MNLRKIVFGVATFWISATWAIAASDEPIHLKLNWHAGETFRYKLNVSANISAAGERMRMNLESGLTLRVVGSEGKVDSHLADRSKYAHSEHNQTVSLGEHLTEVEAEQGDMRMTLNASGQSILIVVRKNSVTASVNGRSLPSYQLTQLRNEMKPVQEFLKAKVRLWMTRSGRVERVSGLEKLDAAAQKELAMGFLQGMLLPEKPLRVGEHFVDKKSLDMLFPSQPGNKKHPLADKTIDIVRTLKSVKPDSRGRVLAELSAPLKERFNNVPLDENGTRGTADFDVLYTTLLDKNRGICVKETAKGTVLLFPKSSSMPSRIKMDISMTIRLVDSKDSRKVAQSRGRN